MMRPPRGCWSLMSLIASCVQRKEPVRLVSTTDCHSSNGKSSRDTADAPRPALLNRRSRRPNVSLVRAKRALTAEGSVTSVGTTSACAPDRVASRAVSSSGSRRRPARTTAYPSRASATAVARPIPDPAPVTTATLSAARIDSPPLVLFPIPPELDAPALRLAAGHPQVPGQLDALVV